MSRDCPDPERFDPNRSLTPNGLAEGTQMEWYDYRKICLGPFFVENALWAAAAMSGMPNDLELLNTTLGAGPTETSYSRIIRHPLGVPSRAEHSSNRLCNVRSVIYECYLFGYAREHSTQQFAHGLVFRTKLQMHRVLYCIDSSGTYFVCTYNLAPHHPILDQTLSTYSR